MISHTVGAAIGVTLTLMVISSPVYLTYPEKGITCIETDNWAGGKVKAGCYTGSVHESGNRISSEATCKYQGLGCK
jgi:hypothetical protein